MSTKSSTSPAVSLANPLFFPLCLLLLMLFGPWACAPTPTQQSRDQREKMFADANDPFAILDSRETTPAEPEQSLQQEIDKLKRLGKWQKGTAVPATGETTYDFPVVINQHVQFYLDFFQYEQREMFGRWLARSGRFAPMIKEHLREAGLPQDLLWLPMIESGFQLNAYSQAKAVGIWQFMPATARGYGLTVNDYIDERRDPTKATQAAVAFLADLYADFGDWHLAVAGYNAGGGRIRRAIKQYETEDFWEIAEENHLSMETRRYVPKLIAAIIIAKNPEAYGFDNITYAAPLRYETVPVGSWTALEAVAVAGEIDFDELRDLNRQLRRGTTPPGGDYPVKVPMGTADLVANRLPWVRAVAQTDYQTHVVKAGDTLTNLCKTYDINKNTLLKANGLRQEQLVLGQRLRIPIQQITYQMTDRKRMAGEPLLANPAGNRLTHTIQPGENLGILAKRYGVSVEQLRAWNKISDPRRLKVGQKLDIYDDRASTLVAGPAAPANKDGEANTIAPVAVKSRPQAAPAPAKTDKPTTKTAATSTPAAQAKTTTAKPAPAPAPAARKSNEPRQTVAATKLPKQKVTYYQVKGGDTIWSIARKFQLTPALIREWNQLTDDLIHPGHRLLIKVADFAS